MSPNRNSDDGYVTLAVLVMAGLLATLVASLLMVSRPALSFARLGADEVVAQGLIEGGLNGAAFLIYGAEYDPRDVSGLSLRFGTGSSNVSVADEGGRINLNAAEPDLLAGLYRAVGGVSIGAAAFSGRAVDWRDQDEDISEAGAEGAEYETAGVTYRPPNRPFRSVDELRLLLGLSRQDFARLKPHVTIYSQSGAIDPISASPTVLRAIPGITRGEVERLLEARRAGQNRQQLAPLLVRHSQYFTDEPSGVYRIGVQARARNGFEAAIEAVIAEPQEESRSDYRVLAWTRLVAAPPRR